MSKSKSNRRRRVAPRNSNRRLPTTRSNAAPLNSLDSFLSPSMSLRVYEDRRTFHPDADYRYPASFRYTTPIVVGPTPPIGKSSRQLQSRFNTPPASVAFETPKQVLTCVRRKIRAEVMHATRKAGIKGQKTPRRSVHSDIHC